MFNKYFYWLEIGGYSVQSLGTLEVIANLLILQLNI